jgi:hypothetical protein
MPPMALRARWRVAGGSRCLAVGGMAGAPDRPAQFLCLPLGLRDEGGASAAGAQTARPAVRGSLRLQPGAVTCLHHCKCTGA